MARRLREIAQSNGGFTRLRLVHRAAWAIRLAAINIGLASSVFVLVGAHAAMAQTQCALGRTLELKSRPNFTIGAADGPEPELFTGVIAAAEVDAGQRVVIANSRPPELRYFTRSGKHIRTVGRRGEGPGEFRMMNAFSIGDNDSVVVADALQNRLSVFGPDGTYVRTIHFSPAGVIPLRIHYLGQSRVVVVSPLSRTPSAVAGIVRDSLVVSIYEMNGSRLATVGKFPGVEGSTTSTGRGVTYDHVAFSRGLLTAAAAGKLFVADNARYLIDIYDLGGQKLRSVGAGAEGRRVTSEDQRRYLASRGQRLRTVFPPQHPAISDLLATRTGGFWVRRYSVPWSSTDALWDVFSSSGVLQCTVRVDPAARVLSASDNAAILLVRDSLGVEKISVLPFEVPLKPR